MKKIIFYLLLISINSFAKIDTVIIDSGHGGKDPGAIEKKKNFKEKDNNLAIALYLKSLIKEKLPWMKVFLTRDRDVYLSLNERTKIVNTLSHNKAIFISIHTNSNLNSKKAEGIEVFYYKGFETEIEVARFKEMKNSYAKYFSESLKIPMTQMIDHKVRVDSKSLAQEISKGVELASKEPIRKVAPSSFFVVSYSIIPSVLVEVGFISSRKFTSNIYQKKIAKGILLGILSFIKKEDKF